MEGREGGVNGNGETEDKEVFIEFRIASPRHRRGKEMKLFEVGAGPAATPKILDLKGELEMGPVKKGMSTKGSTSSTVTT